jgi:hypothetical protein
MSLSIEELGKLAQPGIYAILNESDRKVDVRCSQDCLKSIAGVISDLANERYKDKAVVQDRAKISFKVLEVMHDPVIKKQHHSYWSFWYKDQGYDFYRFRPALLYQPLIELNTRTCKPVVCVRDKNGTKIVVGSFDTMHEANEFLEKYYTPPCFNLIYAFNKLTLTYVLGR